MMQDTYNVKKDEVMLKNFIFIVYFVFLISLAPQVSDAADERIAFFTVRKTDDMFFGLVASFMEEVCDDLGMELTHFGAEGNHFEMVRLVEKAIQSERYDALVVMNMKNRLPGIVRKANAAKIPIFTFNAGFNTEDDMGEPREKYSYWIGEMLPDDEGRGIN